LNATIELEPILEVIAVEAQRAEGADHGTLVMFLWNDEETEIIPTMRFGAQVGKEAIILETAAARSGETLITEAVFQHADPGLLTAFTGHRLKTAGIEATYHRHLFKP